MTHQEFKRLVLDVLIVLAFMVVLASMGAAFFLGMYLSAYECDVIERSGIKDFKFASDEEPVITICKY